MHFNSSGNLKFYRNIFLTFPVLNFSVNYILEVTCPIDHGTLETFIKSLMTEISLLFNLKIRCLHPCLLTLSTPHLTQVSARKIKTS